MYPATWLYFKQPIEKKKSKEPELSLWLNAPINKKVIDKRN